MLLTCYNATTGPHLNTGSIPRWGELANPEYGILSHLFNRSFNDNTGVWPWAGPAPFPLCWTGLCLKGWIINLAPTSSSNFSMRMPTSAIIASSDSRNSKFPLCLVSSLLESEPVNDLDGKVIAPQGVTPIQALKVVSLFYEEKVVSVEGSIASGLSYRKPFRSTMTVTVRRSSWNSTSIVHLTVQRIFILSITAGKFCFIPNVFGKGGALNIVYNQKWV